MGAHTRTQSDTVVTSTAVNAHGSDPAGDTHYPTGWRLGLLPTVLIFLGSVVVVISSLGAPLIPAIAVEYDVSESTAQWSLTSTLLAGAVITPLAGRLSDGRHRREVIVVALVLVLIGCILGALPSTFVVLLIGRVLLGCGLGMVPLAMSIARDHLPRDRAKSTLATLSITTAAGVGMGYPIAGFIADQLGFHAPFWAGAIITVLAIAAVVTTVPAATHNMSKPLDIPGAVLIALGLGLFLLAITEGVSWGWTSPLWLGVVCSSVVLLAVWAWHELRTDFPLVQIRLMKIRPVMTANVAGVVAGVGMYILISLVTRLVQTPTSTGYGMGHSILMAGLVLTPFSIVSLSTAKLLPQIRKVISEGIMLPVGSVLILAGMLMFREWHTGIGVVIAELCLVGVGSALVYAGIPQLILWSVPPDETGSALAMNQVLRTAGYAIGSAVSAAVLAAHTPAAAIYPTDNGYKATALIAIAMCALTAILTVVLPGRQARRSTVSTGELDQIEEQSVESAASGATLMDLGPVEGRAR